MAQNKNSYQEPYVGQSIDTVYSQENILSTDDDISGKHIMVNIRMNKIRTVTTIVAVKMIRNVMIVYLR